MKRILYLLILTLMLTACSSSRQPLMTTEEVIGFADSVGRMYYVNVNINRDYLESHPLKVAERDMLRDKILTASQAWVSTSHNVVRDSIGTFTGKDYLTEKEWSRIQEFGDSLSWLKKYSSIGGPFELDFQDHYTFRGSYSLLRLEEKGHEYLMPWNASVVDKETGDTTQVDIVNTRFSILSNPPLIAFSSLDFKFGNQIYTVYWVLDERAKNHLESEHRNIIRIK